MCVCVCVCARAYVFSSQPQIAIIDITAVTNHETYIDWQSLSPQQTFIRVTTQYLFLYSDVFCTSMSMSFSLPFFCLFVFFSGGGVQEEHRISHFFSVVSRFLEITFLSLILNFISPAEHYVDILR